MHRKHVKKCFTKEVQRCHWPQAWWDFHSSWHVLRFQWLFFSGTSCLCPCAALSWGSSHKQAVWVTDFSGQPTKKINENRHHFRPFGMSFSYSSLQEEKNKWKLYFQCIILYSTVIIFHSTDNKSVLDTKNEQTTSPPLKWDNQIHKISWWHGFTLLLIITKARTQDFAVLDLKVCSSLWSLNSHLPDPRHGPGWGWELPLQHCSMCW